MNDIYESCPIYSNDTITLRLISDDDTEELLNCYADEKVPYFNSDNCNGDIFYYPTLELMGKAMEFWKMSYKTRWFVRMTIILNWTGEKIGTIEMFNRGETPNYGIHGILRIDLMSRYETMEVIESILDLANKHFFEAFRVDWIMTKAISDAKERIAALGNKRYVPVKNFELGNYYGCSNH